MPVTEVGPGYGAMRTATIVSFDPNTGKAQVCINLGQADTFDKLVEIQLPAAWVGPNGYFCGGWPIQGSTIWIATTEGFGWAFVSFDSPDDLWASGALSDFTSGRFLIQVPKSNNTDYTKVIVDPASGITLGDGNYQFQADPLAKILSNNYAKNMEFTEAHRSIIGLVSRDRDTITDRDSDTLDEHDYEKGLWTVGLDPSTSAGMYSQNPPLTESHQVYYEYAYQSYNYTTPENESKKLSGEDVEYPSSFSRQTTRADALSLNLTAPNYLAESIIGTVVDIYGNILDINRQTLPSGKSNLSYSKNKENKEQTFTSLLEQQRRSIAYHFELNARKDSEPDVNNTSDYARLRSRLFIDVDKEGQFKVNIPASSEWGNVPLLTRYENYCVCKADQDGSDNPNKFIRSSDRVDILSEGFGQGAITLKCSNSEYQSYIVPNDRTTTPAAPIKLGTAFHDISKTVLTHQNQRQPSTQNIIQEYNDCFVNTLTRLPKIVSDTVTIGEDAGGRSGTVSMDGSLSVSIGANTIDRQSLWLDCAGGMVSNVGRDKQGISWAGTFDGDIYVQVGGATVSNDSRFPTGNAVKDGVVDIRVVTNATMTVIRVDNTGLRIFTPGSVDIVANQELRLKSLGNMIFDAKNIYMYADDIETTRLVRREPGKTV